MTRAIDIGILTSGGDAPGMNAVIAGACERVEGLGGQAIAVQGGFAGLAEARAGPIGSGEARTHAHEAGTWIGSSRWAPMATPEGRRACGQALEALGAGALIVVGGHGSADGARAL